MTNQIVIDPAIYDWWANRNPYPLEPGEPDPDEQLELFDCAWCEHTVCRVPVRDPEEIFWVGQAKARAWCSQDCHDNHAESANEGRY